jgi:UMF1 family MFS transporter
MSLRLIGRRDDHSENVGRLTVTIGTPWLTRPVLAWALYDVASSAYNALVPTFFGVLFVSVLAVGQPGAQAQWGVIASLALVLAGVFAPMAGALADRGVNRLGLLAGATALCSVATIAMPIGISDGVLGAVALFVVAQVGYTLAVSLYDSLLVRVAVARHLGRVSGLGWALGLGGGIVALLGAIVIVSDMAREAQAAGLTRAFLFSGLVFAAVAIPALLALRRARVGYRVIPDVAMAAANPVTTVIGTLRNWRQYREAFRFLIAFYLINDALVTLLFFVAIIVRARFGLSVEGLLWLALLYHCLAAPSTLAFGHLADRWGPRATIYLMLAILSVAIIALALGTAAYMPVVIVGLLGTVYGSLQAVCRSLLALLVPLEKSAELFGFNAITGRVSAAAGPLFFSAVRSLSGSDAVALLSLLAFLAAGAAVLGTLRMPSPEPVT